MTSKPNHDSERYDRDVEAQQDAELLHELYAQRMLQDAARGKLVPPMTLWDWLLWIAIVIVAAGVLAAVVVTAVRSY